MKSCAAARVQATGTITLPFKALSKACGLPRLCRLRDTTLALTPRLSTPPISFRCGVFYHPGYQIIFIRNRKAASSTFMTVINEALKQEHAGLLTRMRPEKLHAEGKDVDAMWREYTVVSTIRNPWARAGGSHVARNCTQFSMQDSCSMLLLQVAWKHWVPLYSYHSMRCTTFGALNE